MDKETLKKSQQVYRRLLVYLKPHRWTFAGALLAMAVYGATDGVVPFLLRSILNDVFGAQDRRMLNLLPLLLVLFAVIRGYFGFMERYLAAKVGLAIIRDVRNQISKHLLTLSSSFFSRHSSGSLISRMTNDTLLIRSALTDAVAGVLRDLVRLIALAGAAIYLDPVLGGIAFLVFPVCIMPIVKWGKKVRKLSKVGQDQFGGLTSLLQETIIGHKIVQAFGLEVHEQERFERENQNVYETYLRAERYGARTAPTNEIIATLATAGILFYGGYTVIHGVRTQGDFIAFITAVFLMYDPFKRMSRVNNAVQMGNAAAERIFEILDTQSEIADRPNAVSTPVEAPLVEYRDVSFCYETGTEDTPALQNISLTVKPGQTFALVGMSGGGKSTIVNLLPRYYDPQKGGVYINGMDIRDRTLASLRDAISIVSQHTFLFDDTVYNNIMYGRIGADREAVINAAKAANAHAFISALPQGYDTRIGEQGLRLSGGERARIAIARALLKNSPILILDEATAALDSEAEMLVQDAIDRLMQGRTVFVIAHRLATIRNADIIAVVVNGQIVERGTHQELLNRGGEFAKLYEIQFQPNGGASA